MAAAHRGNPGCGFGHAVRAPFHESGTVRDDSSHGAQGPNAARPAEGESLHARSRKAGSERCDRGREREQGSERRAGSRETNPPQDGAIWSERSGGIVGDEKKTGKASCRPGGQTL